MDTDPYHLVGDVGDVCAALVGADAVDEADLRKLAIGNGDGNLPAVVDNLDVSTRLDFWSVAERGGERGRALGSLHLVNHRGRRRPRSEVEVDVLFEVFDLDALVVVHHLGRCRTPYVGQAISV